MDADRFVSIARTLSAASSRRRALAAALSGLAMLGALPADAKKAKKKKPKPNAFGCVDVGQKCAGNDSTCCSGICQGKKPKKGKKDQKDKSTCVAHNASFCSRASDTCTVGGNVSCNPDNPECFCTLTTGNAGYCGDFTIAVTERCRACTKDAECQLEFGPGAACIVLGGICTPLCPTTGTACAIPCV